MGIIVKRYLMLVDIQKNSSYLDCKLANFEFSLVEINTYSDHFLFVVFDECLSNSSSLRWNFVTWHFRFV